MRAVREITIQPNESDKIEITNIEAKKLKAFFYKLI